MNNQQINYLYLAKNTLHFSKRTNIALKNITDIYYCGEYGTFSVVVPYLLFLVDVIDQDYVKSYKDFLIYHNSDYVFRVYNNELFLKYPWEDFYLPSKYRCCSIINDEMFQKYLKLKLLF